MIHTIKRKNYKMNIHSSFTSAYAYHLSDVYEFPQFCPSPRGKLIKEQLGVQFAISDPRDRLPFIKDRNYNLSYFAAEIIWYLSGLNSLQWIAPYAPFWTKISDDGSTCNSAYGHRIFNPISSIQSQWDWCKQELTRDPDSRRAYIHIRTAEDSFNATLDVPCTIGIQFLIREKALYMITTMRSCDMILGLGNDIPAFTMFHELMAFELGLELGDYIHNAGSMHIYESDFKKVENIISNTTKQKALKTHRMLPVTSLFPRNVILSREAQVRSAALSGTPDAAAAVLSHLSDATNELDSFWSDVFTLLTIFWLKKLSAVNETKTAIANLKWHGWTESGDFKL